MKNTVTLTRHYSGFNNRADSYSVGNREAEGNTCAADYVLPAGYVLEAGVIRDPAGIECAVIARQNGPYLVSKAGTHAETQVLPQA